MCIENVESSSDVIILIFSLPKMGATVISYPYRFIIKNRVFFFLFVCKEFGSAGQLRDGPAGAAAVASLGARSPLGRLLGEDSSRARLPRHETHNTCDPHTRAQTRTFDSKEIPTLVMPCSCLT